MLSLRSAAAAVVVLSLAACKDDTIPTTPLLADSLVDNTYLVDLTTGNVVQPGWIGNLLLGQIDVEVLVGITAADAVEIDATLALSDNGLDQDLCASTVALPTPADFTGNPTVLFEVDHLDIDVGGSIVAVDDFRLEGSFLADGSALEHVVVAGTIDTRPLDFLVGGSGDDAVCDTVAFVGISCDPCPDGSGDYCLPLEIDDIEAPLLAGLVVAERTAADIAADPLCP